MDLYEAMSSCRAVRRLRPDPIPDEVLARLVQAAVWAPTGGNVQPWRVILVREASAKQRLGALYAQAWGGYSSQLRKTLAPLPDERRAPHERTLLAGDYLAAHFDETPVIAIFCFDPKQMAITDAGLERPSVVGGGSVYPAVQNFLLAARSEGLGCVLTTLLCQHEVAVKALLAIPDGWGTCAAIPLGYPLRKGHGPLSRRPVDKLAYADRWGAPYR
ncbi:MAG TPA: nitroreductase family protein [Myxococcota bacterium]|nr:nitroreductase family protein [Myxococcota bacterium]